MSEQAVETDAVVEEWWITTDFLARGGTKVMGPFVSMALAAEVRSYREAWEKNAVYYVDKCAGRATP